VDRNCNGVPGDTPIWVRYDRKFVDCIPVAKLALSSSPPKTVEVLSAADWAAPKKIVRRMWHGPIYTLRSGDAVIRSTGNHAVVANGLGVLADTVNVGARLRLLEPPPSEFTTTTPEHAWLLGFFAAEGSVSLDRVSFSNSDRALLARTKEMLERVYAQVAPLYPKLNHSTGAAEVQDRDVAKWYLKKATATYRIPHVEWVKGAGRTQRNDRDVSFKKVPRLILNAPTGIVQSFLDGYIDGDGHRFANGVISQETTDYVLAAGLHHLYQRVGTQVRSLWRPGAEPNHSDVFTLDTLLGTRPRRKAKDVVCEIHIQEDWHDYVYDIWFEGDACTFVAGVGSVVVYNGRKAGHASDVLPKAA